MSVETSLTIIAVTFVILVVMIILFVLQVRRTARNLEISLGIINNHLPVLLNSLQQSMDDVKSISDSLRTQVESLSKLSDRLTNLKALRKGIAAFISTFVKR